MNNKFFQLVFCLFFCSTLFAQKKTYQHIIGNTGASHTLSMKGEYFGTYGSNDVIYEKIDALNHKYKIATLDGFDKFEGAKSYQINETKLSVTNLKVLEKKSNGKMWYVVNIKPINDKKPIEYKLYNLAIGDFKKELLTTNSLDIPFPTKAKAEAFIADLQTLFK